MTIMTLQTKKSLYNLNLFIIVLAIGFLMHWQKNVRESNTESLRFSNNIDVVSNPTINNNILFEE